MARTDVAVLSEIPTTQEGVSFVTRLVTDDHQGLMVDFRQRIDKYKDNPGGGYTKKGFAILFTEMPNMAQMIENFNEATKKVGK